MSAPCPSLGFLVTMAMREDIAEGEVDSLVDDFIRVLESHGLQTGGAGAATLEFVVNREGGPATDADRTLVREWSTRWSNTAAIGVGEIVDLGDRD